MENPTQLYNVNKSITDIGYTTVNFSGTVALNMYQIYPKKIIYPLSGYNSSTALNVLIGAITQAYTVSNFNIGLNYVRNFNIYNTSATDTTMRSVNVEYINASGNLDISAIQINNSATAVKLANAININRLAWSSSNVNLSATVYARDNTTNVVRNTLSLSTASSSGSSVITIPNSYIGVISELYVHTVGNEHITLFVKDKNNNLKTNRRMLSAAYSLGRTNYLGELNFPLYPGESVYFGGELSAAGDRYVKAIVTLTAY